MYVGQYKPVKIPKSGKLHIQKNGYVYWSNASKWDKEKKRHASSEGVKTLI